MLSKKQTHVISLVALVASAWASLATSKDGALTDNYRVTTDCVVPALTNQDITVATDEITEPTGVDFTTFGLPRAKIDVANDNEVSGTVGSVERVCKKTFHARQSDLKPDTFLYTCKDDGEFSCNLLFEGRD